MTDEQYTRAKAAYEQEHPEKKFEQLRLFEMNRYLAKVLGRDETEPPNAMLAAWAEASRLLRANAMHRKGFRLQQCAPDFIVAQAREELGELETAVLRLDASVTSTDAEVAEELADLLGVLFHLGIKMGYTPETLGRTMLAKFKLRFTE